MYDILSLFSVLYPHLSRTTVRQFSRVVIGVLAMTGPTVCEISHVGRQKAAKLPDAATVFQYRYPLGDCLLVIFQTYLLDRESLYILAMNATTVSKSGPSTYGLSRFFSSVMVKRFRV